MNQVEKDLALIKERFESSKLPGMDTMLKMAPINRRNSYPEQKIKILASVILLLYPKKNELFFPLIIRTSKNPHDKHSGQISFPGGKLESNDSNNWTCALRECEEEIGVPSNAIEYFGTLTPNYIPISNFKVYPFVGYISYKPAFNKQDDEVADILEIPLKAILNPEIKTIGEVDLASGTILEDIPYFDIKEQKVWGATAMILNEFITLIN